MYKQKDIVLIPFPYTDLTGKSLRPALIISNKKLNKSEDRLCCLITSKETIEGLIIKEKDLEKSLPYKSWVKPHRIFTVSSKIIKKKLYSISTKFHEEIIKEINSFIN